MSRNLLPLSATAILMAGTALAEVPSVAVDIAPVHSLVARVMQGIGEPDLIVAPGASPHEYSLRPSEAAALQDADLVFWVGKDLTPWLADAIDTLAGDAVQTEMLDVEGVALLEYREGALFEAHVHGDEGHDDHEDHDHEGHDDHDHEEHADHDDEDHDAHDHEEHDHEDHDHDDHAGHDDHEDHDEHEGHEDHDGHHHGAHDAHAWLSPDNAAIWLNEIAAKLSAADPENAGAYFANAAEAKGELEALSTEVNGILEPVRGGKFIVFHDAYQYFETSFSFPASGAISLGDASDPSPARVAQIRDRVADENIACVISEPQFAPGLVAAVMDGSEAKTAVVDPLGATLEPGADLYPQLIANLAKSLAGCLS